MLQSFLVWSEMSAGAYRRKAEDNWKMKVEALVSQYREVDRASLRLPTLGVLGNAFQVPWISLRSQDRRREVWRRSFIGVLGPWFGEAFVPSGGLACRPLVSSLVAAHFRRRLTLLRRWLLLSDSDDHECRGLLSTVDEALDIWRTRRTLSGAITFVISVLGTVGGFLGIARGIGDMPRWGWLVAGSALYIAYQLVVGSFVAKRGLMLGGSSGFTSARAWAEGGGTYRLERGVFEPLEIGLSEIPLDLVLADLFIALPATFFFVVGDWWLGLIFVGALLVNGLAYVRRRHLGRL
jgi:hypothetical protein